MILIYFKALLSSLELDKKSIVLISINDNDSVEAGGSHWSLLVWVKSEKKFYHFDSWGNAPSKSAALQTANKISAAIGSPMPVDIRIVSFGSSILYTLVLFSYLCKSVGSRKVRTRDPRTDVKRGSHELTPSAAWIPGAGQKLTRFLIRWCGHRIRISLKSRMHKKRHI